MEIYSWMQPSSVNHSGGIFWHVSRTLTMKYMFVHRWKVETCRCKQRTGDIMEHNSPCDMTHNCHMFKHIQLCNHVWYCSCSKKICWLIHIYSYGFILNPDVCHLDSSCCWLNHAKSLFFAWFIPPCLLVHMPDLFRRVPPRRSTRNLGGGSLARSRSGRWGVFLVI
jgi:hypothetical protein